MYGNCFCYPRKKYFWYFVKNTAIDRTYSCSVKNEEKTVSCHPTLQTALGQKWLLWSLKSARNGSHNKTNLRLGSLLMELWQSNKEVALKPTFQSTKISGPSLTIGSRFTFLLACVCASVCASVSGCVRERERERERKRAERRWRIWTLKSSRSSLVKFYGPRSNYSPLKERIKERREKKKI